MNLFSVIILIMIMRLGEVVIRSIVPAFFRSEEEEVNSELVLEISKGQRLTSDLVGVLTQRVENFEEIVAAQRETIDAGNRIIAAQESFIEGEKKGRELSKQLEELQRKLIDSLQAEVAKLKGAS